jgi:hypothetical protein
MQVNLRVACVTLIALAGIAGCGSSYSSPSSNPPAGQDSTSDTMPRPGYMK